MTDERFVDTCPECGRSSKFWKVEDDQVRCGRCGTLLIRPLDD